MTEDVRQKAENGIPEASPGGDAEAIDEPSTAQDVGAYPLRAPRDDPRWAVRIVWIWVSMAIFLLLFLITLIVLGYWYD
jgi:hypothetical protein